MLGALLRRRGRLLAAIALLLVVLVGAAVVAFGRSADVVVYNGRSQYGHEAAVTTYEDLAKRQFRGKLCLRTSSNEYNRSFVADRLAKRCAADTERLLRSW